MIIIIKKKNIVRFVTLDDFEDFFCFHVQVSCFLTSTYHPPIILLIAALQDDSSRSLNVFFQFPLSIQVIVSLIRSLRLAL